MGQEIGNDNITAPVTDIPKYSPDAFGKFVHLTPDWDREENRPVGRAKDILDAINIWWRSAQDNQAGLDRFKAAFSSAGLPKLERSQAQDAYEEAQQTANDIIRGIDLVRLQNKPTWDKVETIAGTIDRWDIRRSADTQIVALCEAISQTGDLGLTEQEMRQKIAQYAWDELIALFPYAKASGYVQTTVDELEVEKAEFVEAIRGPFWNENDRRNAGVDFRTYRAQIKKGDMHVRLRRAFKSLYEYAKGDIPQTKSSLDILRLQEEILVALYKENAFELT